MDMLKHNNIAKEIVQKKEIIKNRTYQLELWV